MPWHPSVHFRAVSRLGPVNFGGVMTPVWGGPVNFGGVMTPVWGGSVNFGGVMTPPWGVMTFVFFFIW